jgi:hypothetical protein
MRNRAVELCLIDEVDSWTNHPDDIIDIARCRIVESSTAHRLQQLLVNKSISPYSFIEGAFILGIDETVGVDQLGTTFGLAAEQLSIEVSIHYRILSQMDNY